MAQDASRRFNWARLPLIATISRVLCREVAVGNEYLRIQCEVVRSKAPGRIRLTDEERRRLVDAALAMGGKAMRSVVSIVKPETILAWQRRLEQRKWDYSRRRRRGPGRPRTPGEIEALVCRMAPENTWGYKRICGELKKLGIKLSKSCIADILRRNNLPPSPERKGLTWREFLARHCDVLLCADLFTKEIWTFCDLQRAYVFFVMHLRTRTILVAEVTFSPHSGWLEQQVRNMFWECEERGIQPRFLLRDLDKCFSGGFDGVLKNAGVESIKIPYRAPNENARCERWVLSARVECLNHLVLFGLKSLRRVVHTYQRVFNGKRPHQGIGNRVPCRVRTRQAEPTGRVSTVGRVQCEEFLGGLLRSCRRAG